MAKVNFLELDDIKNEYQILEKLVNRKFSKRLTGSDRVLSEAVELHINGLLDSRVFSLFSKLRDDWEEGLLDIIFEGGLDEDQITQILNSKDYDIMNSSINKLLSKVFTETDPNFTIWEVSVNQAHGYVRIENCGDHRIEQWHQEHSVAKIHIKENAAIDTLHFVDFVKKICGFKAAPSNIEGYVKKELYSDLTTMFIEYMLNNQDLTIERTIERILSILRDNHLITDVQNCMEILVNYFNFEIDIAIKKVSNYRTITSFVVFKESIVINFGRNRTVSSASFAELEQRQAEDNGDFIPERLRIKR